MLVCTLNQFIWLETQNTFTIALLTVNQHKVNFVLPIVFLYDNLRLSKKNEISRCSLLGGIAVVLIIFFWEVLRPFGVIIFLPSLYSV